MPTPDAVRDQYETLPYPPRDPAQELRELRSTLSGELKLASTIFWGGRNVLGPTFRALDAGCGTGDSAIFLAEQTRHSGGQVVGFDLSEASLVIAKARAERRALDNVRFIRGRIEDLPGLGLGPFDYIVSLGVLHHLPDPAAGLAALRAVLAPAGGLSLMVYAEYGRTPIYQLQKLFQVIAPPAFSTGQRLEIVKRTLSRLGAEHWASLGRSAFSGEIKAHGDAGLFDLFLHSQDRAYTVPQLHEWVAGAGLRLLRFDMPILYEPATSLPGIDITGLDGPARQAVAELLNGRIKKHTFFATDSETAIPEVPAWDDEAAIPDWLMYDPAWLAAQVERRPEIGIAYEDLQFQCTLDGFRRDFLRLVDGQRTLGEIVTLLQVKHGKLTRAELMARWDLLYQALSVFGLAGLMREPWSCRERLAASA
ncbi:MAG: class I SAM-dependent methyltransferase [Dehalococcoidia bacterium]